MQATVHILIQVTLTLLNQVKLVILVFHHLTYFRQFLAYMLHLLGLDHEQLTFRHNSRDFRLTDVYGNVVHELIA